MAQSAGRDVCQSQRTLLVPNLVCVSVRVHGTGEIPDVFQTVTQVQPRIVLTGRDRLLLGVDRFVGSSLSHEFVAHVEPGTVIAQGQSPAETEFCVEMPPSIGKVTAEVAECCGIV